MKSFCRYPILFLLLGLAACTRNNEPSPNSGNYTSALSNGCVLASTSSTSDSGEVYLTTYQYNAARQLESFTGAPSTVPTRYAYQGDTIRVVSVPRNDTLCTTYERHAHGHIVYWEQRFKIVSTNTTYGVDSGTFTWQGDRLVSYQIGQRSPGVSAYWRRCQMEYHGDTLVKASFTSQFDTQPLHTWTEMYSDFYPQKVSFNPVGWVIWMAAVPIYMSPYLARRVETIDNAPSYASTQYWWSENQPTVEPNGNLTELRTKTFYNTSGFTSPPTYSDSAKMNYTYACP